jgi:hypothetical protein
MSRKALRVLVALGLVGVGWSAGRAQTARPDFEIIVKAPAGSAEVTCVRGCSITWAPVSQPEAGPVDIKVPTPTLRGVVDSTFRDGCVASSWSKTQNCRIWGWVNR